MLYQWKVSILDLLCLSIIENKCVKKESLSIGDTLSADRKAFMSSRKVFNNSLVNTLYRGKISISGGGRIQGGPGRLLVFLEEAKYHIKI